MALHVGETVLLRRECDGKVLHGRLKNQSVSVVYFFEVDLSR